MIRSDHPSDTKRGCVCIFYKEHLPFVWRRDITFLDECIVGEIKKNNKKCFITCLYRSPNQTIDEVDNFLTGFEKICSSIALESSSYSVVIDAFIKYVLFFSFTNETVLFNSFKTYIHLLFG